MLERSAARILDQIGPGDLVLDVGGGARPFERADWVLDVCPYERRGSLGDGPDPAGERFSAETWVVADMCDRQPWPFADGAFAFAVCSHTLEDVRDPVWVCAELQRVARAGYIEVPSRREEQSLGVHGPWAGWSHHRWLIDVTPGGLDFVHKPHVLHFRDDLHLPGGFRDSLSSAERVQPFFWRASFTARERILLDAQSVDGYLAEVVRGAPAVPAPRRLGAWMHRRAGRTPNIRPKRWS